MNNDTATVLAEARARCSTQGLRLTTKRQRIFQLILEANEPLSAYRLYDLYQENYLEKLPVVSVYRMLAFLTDAGLIHKLDTTNQYTACSKIERQQHSNDSHQFLICDRCHSVHELGLSRKWLNQFKNYIDQTGFIVNNTQLELHGMCQHCAFDASVHPPQNPLA